MDWYAVVKDRDGRGTIIRCDDREHAEWERHLCKLDSRVERVAISRSADPQVIRETLGCNAVEVIDRRQEVMR